MKLYKFRNIMRPKRQKKSSVSEAMPSPFFPQPFAEFVYVKRRKQDPRQDLPRTSFDEGTIFPLHSPLLQNSFDDHIDWPTKLVQGEQGVFW